jgi:hypothetical protein
MVFTNGKNYSKDNEGFKKAVKDITTKEKSREKKADSKIKLMKKTFSNTKGHQSGWPV